uniref:Uncharacterized protein n=1 Tax=Kalanchoe fedtschenkoi TaxID=63787 RepID=A0A7N0UFU0_KALFE
MITNVAVTAYVFIYCNSLLYIIFETAVSYMSYRHVCFAVALIAISWKNRRTLFQWLCPCFLLIFILLTFPNTV